MSYCTLADILGAIPEQELTQLTDDSIPPVMVNQAVVDQAIAAAETLINGYIGGRYPLPLATVPELVKSITLEIAVYKIYLRRKKKMPSEAVKAGYDDAMRLLRDIQGGKLSLGVDQAGIEVKPVTGSGAFTTSERIFSRESMKGL